jgi:hypothetical protein
MRRRHSRGQSLVEFALVAPLLFFILLGLVDFMRLLEAYSTVADAARQGARQAVANGSAADSPWASPGNGQPCQGTSFTSGATGTGCLTDARIKETIAHVVQPLGGTVNLFSNTLASACNNPTSGNTNVCIAPAETGAAGTDADCVAAKTRLGHDPQPGELGSRNAEWTFPKYKGCFLVQVTVKFTFAPWTPFGPRLTLTSSTSMIGEEF